MFVHTYTCKRKGLVSLWSGYRQVGLNARLVKEFPGLPPWLLYSAHATSLVLISYTFNIRDRMFNLSIFAGLSLVPVKLRLSRYHLYNPSTHKSEKHKSLSCLQRGSSQHKSRRYRILFFSGYTRVNSKCHSGHLMWLSGTSYIYILIGSNVSII